jgi:hypothetical protein
VAVRREAPEEELVWEREVTPQRERSVDYKRWQVFPGYPREARELLAVLQKRLSRTKESARGRAEPRQVGR